MAFFERRARPFLILLAVGLLALAVKQVLAIARYGFGRWLRGEGPYQTEWEVAAVLMLLLLAVTLLVAGAWRAGEGLSGLLYRRRLTQIVRRRRR